LPPALVQVAEHDPIRDDGLRYATALQAVGVPVRTTTYVGMPHGYLAFPKLCRSAPQALEELCAELNTALAGGRLFRSALEPGQLRGQALNAKNIATGPEPRSGLR
jgi:hypothetical protein